MICQQIENNCLCCMIVTKIEFNESQPELSREKKKRKRKLSLQYICYVQHL